MALTKMAEIIYQRRKVVWIFSEPTPLIILLMLCLVQISFNQVINGVPHFLPQIGDMSQFILPEDTPVGTPVYHLRGVDPENGPLRYSISGQYFTVDPSTGVVILAKALDREEEPFLEVIISITDESIGGAEPNTVSLRRVIPVKDINDNPPIFHNRPYILNISEATPVGSEIEITPNIIVTDKDEGVNAEIKVKCSTKEKGSDMEACSVFRPITDKISENEFHVRIFLNKPLDYESRTAYIITLVASDISEKPLGAVASIAVSVYDVQDQPPVFVNAPYSATVPENSPPETSILEIVAKDGDIAIPRPILLTLEGDVAQYFKLVPDKPLGRATLVTTEIPIDRESDIVMQNGGVYSFSVKATELINNEVPSDYTVTQVTIIVTDVDDHTPQFNQEVYDVSIPENIENGSPIPGLYIYVEDIDIGQNSKYNLKLRDIWNSEGVFALSTLYGEGRTPLNIKVTDSSKLDFDVMNEQKRNYVLEIVTFVDNRELSSARVNIKLMDINDNAPIFKQSIYNFKVLENTTIGSKIGDIEATDKDYGIFSEIEYSLTGFGSHLFYTNKSMGGLFIAQSVDYETQKSYSLNIIAKDGGGKVSTASIFIDIVDVNDNAPTFEYSEYTRTIRDGASSFEPQFIIHANDADGSSQGAGRIKYSIISDNSIKNKGRVFNIDEETGELTILRKLETMDTPKGQYELIIRATDFGVPPLYNETKVFIRVGIPGNQRPIFKGNYHVYEYPLGTRNQEEEFTFEMNPMNYQATIREDAKPNQNVTMVVANDPDGLDDLLTYHIVSGARDKFVINEKTGLITVSNDSNLDLESNPEKYQIIVSAVDSGKPIPETATTTVFVDIQDVNNKPPKFNKSESTSYINEKTDIGKIITTVTAYDTDINSKLKYLLLKPLKAFSKSGVLLKPNSAYDYNNVFRIDEDTGDILVNGTLDYSKTAIFILTVKAIDINAEINKEQQYAITEHTVYIQPFADNNPQFLNVGWTTSNPTIYHKIKEEQPAESTILVLTAEDPMSGHLVSNFKVINTETDLIQVNTHSGQVVLRNHLDYEELKNPNLTFTVKVTSNDGSKYSLAKVVIEVENINDNSPIFEKELYKVSILESAKYPEQIVTVNAHDADIILTEKDKLQGYSHVIYKLKGENSELFIINNVTGAIQIAPNKTLDREFQSVLRLEVEAVDTPKGGAEQLKSSSAVLIDVLDVDDNSPTFEKNVYIAVVPENVPVGISVINITAADPDEGLGGEIKYEFLDEGEVNGLFTIDPSTGEIKTHRNLTGRGRTEPYRFLIGAVDGGGHEGDTSLSLYIGDVSANDGVPRFIRPLVGETLIISENATIGSSVFQVVASDPDDPTQPSGQLYYSIQQSNEDAKTFSIDPKSGLIKTRQTLDREQKSTYTLVLTVTDQGDPPQQSTRIITVTVTDIDDHKPHFARNVDDPPILMTTKEEIPVGSVIGNIEALDEDVGENAAIDYAITAGNDYGLIELERTNDSKAIIKAAARLDREIISKILITVKCYKHGSTTKLSKTYNRLDPSQLQVLIKIIDIDDHLPDFGNDNLTIGVRLNVPIDTVISTVKAKDKDPEALPINYFVVNMTFESPIKSKSENNITDVILVNNVSGEMRIMKNLIHYADGVFRLVIRANNSKQPDRFKDLPVEVVVVRERDLLRLVLEGSTRSKINDLRDKMAAALASKGLRLQLHESANTAFYSKPGPCFQFRKMKNGEALTPKAMKAAIRSLGSEFQKILETFNVHNVTSCGTSRQKHSSTQKALLSLAAVLPVAAFVAAVVLCFMHSAAKRRARSAPLLARDQLVAAPSNASIPTRLYAEPLYST